MNFLSTLRNRLRASLIKGQSGQGATEYILLLVVVVGLVIILKKPIMKAMGDKMNSLDKDIQGVTTDSGN